MTQTVATDLEQTREEIADLTTERDNWRSEASRLMDSASHTPSLQLTMRLMHASQELYTVAQQVRAPWRSIMSDSMNAMDMALVDVERELLPATSTPRTDLMENDNFPTRRHVPGGSVVAAMPPLEPIPNDKPARRS